MSLMDPSWMLDEMALEAERVLGELRRRLAPAAPPQRAVWRPPVDIIETAKEIILRCDLPGVKPEQVRIALSGDVLAVEGRRDPPGMGCDFRYLRKEIGLGPFAFAVRLPFCPDPRSARATIEDGSLLVRMPRSVEVRIPGSVVTEIRL
jgi:HSP20 family protein